MILMNRGRFPFPAPEAKEHGQQTEQQFVDVGNHVGYEKINNENAQGQQEELM